MLMSGKLCLVPIMKTEKIQSIVNKMQYNVFTHLGINKQIQIREFMSPAKIFLKK